VLAGWGEGEGIPLDPGTRWWVTRDQSDRATYPQVRAYPQGQEGDGLGTAVLALIRLNSTKRPKGE
jgi:hypothetical protein